MPTTADSPTNSFSSRIAARHCAENVPAPVRFSTVDADRQLPDIAPGVLTDGDDIGRWLQQQKQPAFWARLLPEQHERLTALGVQPAERPTPAPARWSLNCPDASRRCL
ncbi:hypothetical protein T261_0079 [Streptomyces lydicus]|nr:hypothetical protein T261_0079 [Streptomyces lydicus]